MFSSLCMLSASASRTQFASCMAGLNYNYTKDPTYRQFTTTAYISVPTTYNGITGHLYGAFCPPTTGYYNIREYGGDWGGVWLESNYAGDTYATWVGSCVSNDNVDTITNLYLEKGRCYRLTTWAIADGCWSSRYNYAQWSYTSPESYSTMNSGNTFNCSISGECNIGYVGSNCEAVDLDCHGNGVPSDGVSGDKNTCVCTNGLEPFCDDMTTVDSGHVDPTITFTYGDIEEKSESINVGQDTVNYYSSYANYSVTGKITIPQNGDYKFRISSQNDVMFTISGTSISIGSIDYSNQFQCQEDRVRTYETASAVTLTKGDYNFEIKGLSGCGIEDQYFSLEWIFYRYYISSGKTAVYTTVPRRYLKAP